MIINPEFSGGPTGGGGGGGSPGVTPPTIIILAENWTMTTFSGSDNYVLIPTTEEIIEEELRFKNIGDVPVNISMSCQDVINSELIDAKLCERVTFGEVNFILPVDKVFETSNTFFLDLPVDIQQATNTFNIIATDELGSSEVVTVVIKTGGFLSVVIKPINKITGGFIVLIGGKEVSLLFISLLIGIFLGWFLFRLFYKGRFDLAPAAAFLTGIVAFVLAILLLPTV